MPQSLLNITQLALAILIMSSSGTLGRYILLPPPVTIWVRCLIGAFALGMFLLVSRKKLRIPKGSVKIIIGSTLLLGVHWVSYFYALKLSTVAIGMLALFTYPLFTAILEPILLKLPSEKRHLPLSVLALIGLYFLVPEFSLKNEYTLGILVGLLSSITYALRNILMKKNIESVSATVMMFYQLLGLSFLLILALFWLPIDLQFNVISNNWKPLLILGLLTTAMGHTMFVASFKYFSVTTVSILSNLTPLFGIGLGIWVLGEIPEGNVFIGGSIILSLTLIESFYTVKKSEEQTV